MDKEEDERTEGFASSGPTTTSPIPGLVTSYSIATVNGSNSSVLGRIPSLAGVGAALGVLPIPMLVLTMHPCGIAIPSSPSSPSFSARQICRFISGYVWMFSGCVRAGVAGGRWEKASGTTVGRRREHERMESERACSQTVRRSAAVGTIVNSV